jgi:heterotetrameric sarcosine oxidase gamma subunit
VTLDFLSPAHVEAGGRFQPVARSPLERQARAAGARFEVRDGWRVATSFGDPERELERCLESAGYADRSALGKLELQAAPEDLPALAGAPLALGAAVRTGDGWWCPLARDRALRLAEPDATMAVHARLAEAAGAAPGRASVVDLTAAFGALTVVGPLAREVLARLTALDLRAKVAPPGSFRPGSVARVPAMVLCEAPARHLVLFGAAHAQYVWTALADAAAHLGAGPVGADALEAAASA